MKQKFQQKTWYLITVFMFFISLIAGQLASHQYMTELSNMTLKLAFLFLFIGSLSTLKNRYQLGYAASYAAMLFILAVFWDVSYLYSQLSRTEICFGNAMAGLVALNSSTIIWLFHTTRAWMKRERSSKKENYAVCLVLAGICILYAALFTLNFKVWFRMDNFSYYHSVVETAGTWNFSFTNLRPFLMAAHLSYAYAILLTVGELLLPKLGYGQRIINLLMSLVTIVTFYKVTEKIWGHKKQLRCILLTFIFAFAPLFYGISYLHSSDFALLCFLTVFFFASFYRLRALKFVMAIGICFTKEPGVVFLAGALFSEFVTEFIRNKSYRSRKTIRKALIITAVLIIVPVLLCVFFLMRGTGIWADSFRKMFSKLFGGESLDNYRWWYYVVIKIFESFFMHFNWLIVVLFVYMVYTNINYCKKENLSWKKRWTEQVNHDLIYYLPILGTYAMFFLFSIGYFTFVHYRYMQVGHLFFVLCIGMIMDAIPENTIKKDLILLPIGLIFFAESFITFDPVTYQFFRTFDAGNGQMVSTRRYWAMASNKEGTEGYYLEVGDEDIKINSLAEGIEYNRESIGLQKVLTDALVKINYDSSKLLILDNFGIYLENTQSQVFGSPVLGWNNWDPVNRIVTRLDTGVPIVAAADDINLEEIQDNYTEIYYFDFPYNNNHVNTVLEDHASIDHFEESCFRWKIDVYRLK